MRALSILVTLLISGCFMQNRSTIERIGDAVQGLNDETRWGKTTLAAERVTPQFREHFLASHGAWGNRIQLADCDLVSLQLSPDEERATSVVSVSWYRLDTMELSQSTIRQTWRRHGTTFVLSREAIVAGDQALLEPPADWVAAIEEDEVPESPAQDG